MPYQTPRGSESARVRGLFQQPARAASRADFPCSAILSRDSLEASRKTLDFPSLAILLAASTAFFASPLARAASASAASCFIIDQAGRPIFSPLTLSRASFIALTSSPA